MGLTEKRAIKEFQDTSYADLVAKVNAAAGYEPTFEVNWDSLAVEEYGHLYNEGFTQVYFEPLINAITDIAADELGKEALKETLKKIVIKNDGNIYSPSLAYSFDGGVLIIDHSPITNIGDVDDRTKYLVKFLSSKL